MTDPNPRPTRRERERQRHRQEILEAARAIVADRGLEHVTVEQVARQAEFAVGSIYRHFASKEELILAVLGDFAEHMIEEMAEVLAEDEPYLVRLEHLVRASLAQQAECRPLFDAVLALPGPLPMPGGEVEAKATGMKRRMLAVLDAAVAAGEAEGVLSEGRRTSHALMLAALLFTWAKVAALGDIAPGTDVAAEVLRSFLDGARARGGQA